MHMRIAVIGTGMVGRAFAERLTGLGHDVVIGTRDPQVTLARTEPDNKGTGPFAPWHAEHPDIPLLPSAAAGAHGELIINVTAGDHALDALTLVGADNLAGKVLLDISLPLDLSEGMPPKLLVANDDSLGEQVQRAFPDTRVVKSLTNTHNKIMLNPALLPGTHNTFVAGNDRDAKATVRALLGEFGWPAEVIIDLGDITAARALEMYSRLHFTLAGQFGNYWFNLAIVRTDTID